MVTQARSQLPRQQGFQANVDIDTRLPVLEASGQPQASLRALAGNLSELATQTGQWADSAATQEGRRAGEIEGAKEGYTPKRDNTIWGAAYDASGNRQLLMKVETDARAELMQAAIQFGEDPAAMKAAGDKIRMKYAGSVQQTVPEMAGDINAAIQRLSDSYTFQAGKEYRAKSEREDREGFAVNTANQATDIARQARAGSGDPNLGSRIEADVARLNEQVDKRSDLTPLQKQKLKDNVRSTAIDQMIEGQIDAITDPAQLQRFAAKLKEDWTGKRGAIGGLNEDQFSRVEGAVERRQRALQAGVKEQVRALDGSLNEIETRVLKAENIAPARLAAAATRLAQADPTGAAAERMNELVQLQEWGRNFRTIAVGDQRATVGRLDERAVKSGLTPQEESRRTIARIILAERDKDDAADFLGTAGKHHATPIRDIDFNAPNFADQARARVFEAERFAKEQGRQPEYLKRADRERLKAAIEADPANAISIGSQIMQGFGDKAPRVLKEISADMPGLAYALRPGNAALADGWLKAETATRAGVKLPSVQTDQVRDAMRKQGLDQLFQGRDIEMAQLADAARPIVAQRLGVNAGKFDPLDKAHRQIMDDVLNDLVGRQRDVRSGRDMAGPVKMNGHTTLAPTNIVSSQFPTLVRVMTEADFEAAGLKPMGSNGKPISFGDLQGARWQPAGKDKYRIAIDPSLSSANPWVGGADGKPLVIDLSPASPIINRLRQRAPGLFR
jgi:hypothetical protein